MGGEIETIPLAMAEAQRERSRRTVTALALGWAVSVASMLAVMAWLTFAG